MNSGQPRLLNRQDVPDLKNPRQPGRAVGSDSAENTPRHDHNCWRWPAFLTRPSELRTCWALARSATRRVSGVSTTMTLSRPSRAISRWVSHQTALLVLPIWTSSPRTLFPWRSRSTRFPDPCQFPTSDQPISAGTTATRLDSAQPLSTTGGIQPAPGFSHADWEKSVREGRVILVHPPGQRLPLILRRLMGALRLVGLTVSSVCRRWFRASGSPSRGPRGGSTRRIRGGRS